jgi:N-acetylglucosaminyldiphosphoundecaprenol N-acetyl-beta-D-mannosaminyltransferase
MERLTLLGVEVQPLTMDEIHRALKKAFEQGKQVVVAHHNLHSIYLYHTDAEMRAFYKQVEIAHIDGMPLVFWARLMGYKVDRSHRVTYVDWIRPLLREARDNGWRVFYLGGKPGVAHRAAEILKGEIPGLELETHHGYFDMEGEDNERVLEVINAFGPHVLLVGMGMPRQEKWVLRNRARLKANAILTAGACFDYVAGAIPTPPRWMGQLGLEWLYRLVSEPRRLWRRYLVEPVYLLPYFWQDVKGVLGKRASRGNA